jgi:glycosyltransferase involved in cell wall biosynthesis
MKPKLLELCLSPDLGGLELYMVRSAKALDDDFNVLSVINLQSKLEQYYEDTDYRYEKLSRKGSFSPRTALKLAKIIDQQQIDIIHMHWTKDLPVAVMAKVFSKRKPKLVQTRNMTMTRFKNDFYHRFLYKHMDKILPVTHQVADQIQKFIPEDIRPEVEVLYMGSDEPVLLEDDSLTDLRQELGMANTFAIGMVGRIEETKGQYLLIEAMKQLVNEGKNVKAFFVGHPMEESYLDALKQKVMSYGLEESVNFLGFMKNPHHFMQACDAIVLATECETFGLVLIEAMQAGTAVVATNQCGPLEIIDDGASGLLFEKGSSESLAKGLKQLVKNTELLKRLALAGKQKAQEYFSNKKQFSRLCEVLKGVV